MSKAICIYVKSILVADTDADGKPLAESVVLLRHPSAGIFGVDESFIEGDVGPIRDPFDGRSILYQENFTDPEYLAKMGRTEPYGIVYRWVGGDTGWSGREVTGAENLVARYE